MQSAICEPNIVELAPVIERLDKDTKAAAARMGRDEARYLVDRYYQEQERSVEITLHPTHVTIRDLCNGLEALYTRFILTNRFQCIWPDTLTAIRTWIQEAK